MIDVWSVLLMWLGGVLTGAGYVGVYVNGIRKEAFRGSYIVILAGVALTVIGVFVGLRSSTTHG